jgi:hypothetical protein
MTTDGDLDRTLATWFEREARADGAATLLEATLAETSRRRPQPAWRAGLGGGRLGRIFEPDDRTLARLRYAAIVAALAAALAVVGLIAVGQQQPVRRAPSLFCVGQPATLCSYGAGEWTSTSFLPGLTVTFPDDSWYARDLPDVLELKQAPMNSAVYVQLDPVPAASALDGGASPATDVAGIVEWLERNGAAQVVRLGDRKTPNGLSMTSLDVRATDPRKQVKLLVVRGDEDNLVLAASHYEQRLHLVDVGDGHVLSIHVMAFNSSHATVVATDKAFDAILDSLRPPASIAP